MSVDESVQSVIEELARVRNVGPARAKQLYQDLHIDSLEALIEAAKQDKLLSLSGIGKKTQASILQSAERALVEKQEALEALDVSSEPSEPSEPSEDLAVEAEPAPVDVDADIEGEGEPEDLKVDEDATVEALDAVELSEPKAEADEPQVVVKASAASRFFHALICPNCGHDSFTALPGALVCEACRREYDRGAGFVELAPPTRQYDVGLAQRLMETEFYAQRYEQLMRPTLTKLVSPRSLPEEYALATRYLELFAGARLLDVACGTGNFTRHFAQALSELDAQADDAAQASLLVGLDLSAPMLTRAAQYLEQARLQEQVFLVRGDATRQPFGRGSFDRVHCAGALHMMEDPDEVLRQFARVLVPDGRLVIGTFVEGSGLVRRALKRAAQAPTHFRWFNRQDLDRRLGRAGFEVIDASQAKDALTLVARRI